MLLVLLSREPLRTSHVLLACYTKAMHLAGAVEHAGVCGLCFTHAAHAGWRLHLCAGHCDVGLERQDPP